MSDQLSLLALVLAVGAGLVTVTVSALVVQSRRTRFSRYFLGNILLFNILILAGLVFRYVQMQPDLEPLRRHPWGLHLLLVVLAALKLVWLNVYTVMNRSLPVDIRPGRLARYLPVSSILLFLVYALLPVGRAAVDMVLELFVLTAAAAASVHLLVRTGRLPRSAGRDSLLWFAGFHTVLFSCILISLFLAWLQIIGESSWHVLVNSTFLIAYNLFPLVWILRFSPADNGSPSAVFDRYGITPREREIVEMIREGKTNQEIADSLFISLATVKDHNYNIFRKTGVRNRVELANLFREEGES
jgi:DNA-binding CsgD family transcriptional regulator